FLLGIRLETGSGTDCRSITGFDMSEKTRIVSALGEQRLLLPFLLNEALSANDRAKYRLTLLQTAKARVDSPDGAFSDLRTERLACGIADAAYDDIVAGSVRHDADTYLLPKVGELCSGLHADMAAMLAPLEAARVPEMRLLQKRLEELSLTPWHGADNTITGNTISRLAAGDRAQGDSLHLLIMDIHKLLNRLQAEIATEGIDGAQTYGLRADERPLVSAFMKGVNRTRALKFDHPGLDSTATRVDSKLVIQNDLGTTDAHVLVVHVEGLCVTTTYTDNHLPRLLFFQAMFSGWKVAWGDVHSRTDQTFADGVYHLCVGTYTACDKADLKAYLIHLGSRLVFLIDWNRARKRLQLLVPRTEELSILTWAAENDLGHMAFLKAGGERMIFDALQFVAGGRLTYGVTLAELLGIEAAVSYLRFILKACTQGLLAKRPLALIRDEARVELYTYYHSAQQGLLDLASDHGALA